MVYDDCIFFCLHQQLMAFLVVGCTYLLFDKYLIPFQYGTFYQLKCSLLYLTERLCCPSNEEVKLTIEIYEVYENLKTNDCHKTIVSDSKKRIPFHI